MRTQVLLTFLVSAIFLFGKTGCKQERSQTDKVVSVLPGEKDRLQIDTSCCGYLIKETYFVALFDTLKTKIDKYVFEESENRCHLYSIFSAGIGNGTYSYVEAYLDGLTGDVIQKKNPIHAKRLYYISLVIGPVCMREKYRREVLENEFHELFTSGQIYDLCKNDDILSFCADIDTVDEIKTSLITNGEYQPKKDSLLLRLSKSLDCN